MHQVPEKLIDLVEFRDKERVLDHRRHAGRVLARMLKGKIDPESLVLAIPAGGVPVGCALAGELGLEVDIFVVSKITFPWNSEAGYGAVAQSGLVRLNNSILVRVHLSDAEIEDGIQSTRDKVKRRALTLRGKRPPLDIKNRPVVLVDDGIASGTTMSVAIEAVSQMEPASIVLAIPTGHLAAIQRIGVNAHRIFCANVRSSSVFAVANAYRNWSDVDETTVMDLLARHG